MEINVILPVFAASSVILLIIGKIYYIIRTKFPVKVNCWFCNSNTNVPYNSSNSWYCPHCDQYNGFWPDGSYNRILQDQFNEKLNCGSWCSKIKKKLSKTNGLCNFCNINLELKIQQLAQFVPFNKENYDEEVQQYSDQLERVYRLCSRCQVTLDQTLKEKYKTFVTDQLPSFKTTFDVVIQPKLKQRHPAYLCLSTLLSLGLLLSAVPSEWSVDLMSNYPLPDFVLQLKTLAQQYFPNGVQSLVFLAAGVITHAFDCAFMRDFSSVVNLLLWIIVFSLAYIPQQFDKNIPLIFLVASIVLFVTSMGECRKHKTRSIAAVKPVQLQKLDGKSNIKKRNTNSAIKEEKLNSNDITELSNSSVSDPKPPHPAPSLIREPTPEDFGLGKLNVSSRRVTRSQTKHFPTKKIFGSQSPSDIFKSKSINLSPPKLQLDKSFDYQAPQTRSSSQSSGFVSLSHQKYLDESRSPSVIAEDLDSISQCGGNALIPYPQPPLSSPFSFSHPYTMPYPQFTHPYTIMHFTPNGFNKFYQYSQFTPYESPFNMSAISMQNSAGSGWFQSFKSILSSSVLLFLITSNIAILWKIFGEDYFNLKT